MLPPAPTGQLFVVSAPSGVGKTTMVRAVRALQPGLRFSVSCTTRPARPREVPGQDYHFVSREEFLRGIEAGRFVEWAEVHGEYYGTDAGPLQGWLQAACDVVLDIDVQGARQVRCRYPQAHTIFVIPPSLEALRERLEKRGTESPEQMTKRLAAGRRELQEAPWYDFIIVNDLLENAVSDLSNIIRACRCRRAARAHRLEPFLHPQGSH
jgi:guanylate kinase